MAHLSTFTPFLSGRLPGQFIIQYTNRCNADCPQCGMRRSASISRNTLPLGKVRQLIDSAAQRGVQSLSFTGGEPLLFLDDIISLIRYASDAGIPYIRTGTNGFLFRNSNSATYTERINRVAEKLASTNIYTFWISLDSASPEDHERMRGMKGLVSGIEKALPIFHSHSIFPAVNLGINRAIGGSLNQPSLGAMAAGEFLQAFKRAFSRFYTLACNLGFTMVNGCYPMSSSVPEAQHLNTVYGASSASSLVTFSHAEKALLFQALFETIPSFRGKLRIFTPRCSLFNLMQKFRGRRKIAFPCRGGHDFFFADCNQGNIHPCGFLQESLREIPLSGRGKAQCDLCEWECFRDPSDVLGPFAEFFSQPHRLLAKTIREPRFFRLLLEDLRYSSACGYFNGRTAPHSQRMKKFAKNDLNQAGDVSMADHCSLEGRSS